MIEATSCGGVVIFRGRILVLYKNYKNKYKGWVLPKGTMEPGESREETAIREVKEESGSDVRIREYIGETQYDFFTSEDVVNKHVHWFLCEAFSYDTVPQKEEYFKDSGFYKFHEAYHLLKFANEKQMLEDAFKRYVKMKKENTW